jgi:DNA-binding CsgD family transcriptional regulator/Tfp pilus assembly protein PilF
VLHSANVDVSASVGIAVTGEELPRAVEELRALLAEGETPDLHLGLGLVTFLFGDLREAEQHMHAAFRGFRREGRNRRAALAATHLGRLEHAGFANPAVAAGWFARALGLLEDDEDCVERGWLALGMLGCSVVSADELDASGRLALRLARAHGDGDLECRALADYGLALVSQGRFAEGMAQLDQAMTFLHSGECTNLWVVGQVNCSFISACERAGDVPRLEGWLAVAVRQQPTVMGPEAPPNVLLNHCRTEYGTLLCLAGRWGEAEATLRQAADEAPRLMRQQQIIANCALADLRVSQGRFAEAAELLAGVESWDEACLPLVRLHLGRGLPDRAAAACHVGLSRCAGDRLRGSALLALLVDAELARGDLDAAAEAVGRLATMAGESPRPPIVARAVLGAARLDRARGDVAGAVVRLEDAIGSLDPGHWALLCAEVHLELATALAATRPRVATAHARHALGVFGPIGAPQRFAAQRLLAELGDDESGPGPLDVLTAREREILRLVAQGLSNPQIAGRLFISARTAEHHVGAILRKLGLQRRSEAAVFAATLDPELAPSP